MPKLRDGMKHIAESAKEDKEEALYKKYSREFELGTIPKEILMKLSHTRQKEYFDKQYARKYKRRIVWKKDDYGMCSHCVSAGYFEDGYVSDAQIRVIIKPRADDIEWLHENYPTLCEEMDKLNPGIFGK